MIRVALTVAAGYVFAIPLPRALGVPALWGAAGLTTASGLAGLVEMLLLRRGMNARIGRTGLPGRFVIQVVGASVVGAVLAWSIRLVTPVWHPLVMAAVILGPYGLAYLAVTGALRVPEAVQLLRRIRPARR